MKPTTLKDVMRSEAASVFLNVDEFGEALTIDGVPTVGVWDDTTTSLSGAAGGGSSRNGIGDVNSFGLAADTRDLYVPVRERCGAPANGIPVPVVDQRMNIDGEYWTVLPGTQVEQGLLHLKLMRVYS